MEISSIFTYALLILVILFVLVVVLTSFYTVKQGSIAVITRFGKYKRISLPGLNFKTPLLDVVSKTISIQNKSTELNFQAITIDQANVSFKAMLLYSVKDSLEETIKNVAFKFNSDAEFLMATTKTIESSIRAFVATKRQAEVLGLRKEIIDFVKDHLDVILSEWGYHLLDLQINDIAFDPTIMQSMARVVASSNLKAAAENEGQALLITKTKAAEAEGNAIKISAEAEKEAAKLRGQGVASFREEVAKGLSQSAEELKQSGLDTNVILFSMWTEAIKNFAEAGKGNVIFLDGSPDGMTRQKNQIMSLMNPVVSKNFQPTE